MACSALVTILSLLCLLQEGEYCPNQRASSSTVNEMLSSELPEEEESSIG